MTLAYLLRIFQSQISPSLLNLYHYLGVTFLKKLTLVIFVLMALPLSINTQAYRHSLQAPKVEVADITIEFMTITQLALRSI